jgi:nucleotidyltransferase substrate binding protein (TIGR01987 family)
MLMGDEDQLDISSLRNAVAAFERIAAVYRREAETAPDNDAISDTLEGLRAGLIQAFEFTYELSWKYMKRWLGYNLNPEAVRGIIPRRELFRLAAEGGLITDVTKWFNFHEDRNRTSHIYDEEVADEVHNSALDFLPYAQDFLSRLEQRL